MLRPDQIDTFRLALGIFSLGGDEEAATPDDAHCTPERVTQTADQIADFIATWGQPHETEQYSVGTLLIWRGLQTRKGARRGDLFVMDFGDARAAHFDGEA